MVYYTQTELNVIQSEINTLIFTRFESELKKFKIDARFYNSTDKYLLLCIVQDLISTYVPVTSNTDGILNNISENKFQLLVEKVYKNFPTLKYPR